MAMTERAVTSRREVMGLRSGARRYVARPRGLAERPFRHRLVPGRQRRPGGVNRAAVLAVVLGPVGRVVGGGHQPGREWAGLPAPLSDADPNRNRDLRADASPGVATAHRHDTGAQRLTRP